MRTLECAAFGSERAPRLVPAGIVLIDDHAILRDGLRALLDAERDFQVIAEAGTLAEGMMLSKRVQPDVAIIDMSFSEGSAIAAIGTLRRACPGTGIIVLTVHNTPECRHAAMNAGAHGFVAKDAVFEDLLSAIRSACSWHEHTAQSLPSAQLQVVLAVRRRDSSAPRLTSRERQVLVGVAQGYTSKEIATTLDRSVKTVIKHRSNMMRKLSLHDASSVTRFAIANGLLVP